jgi:Methyltransferase domain
MITIDDIIQTPPQIHRVQDGCLTCYGLAPEVLRWLYHRSDPTWRTLETGCGLSTIALALRGCRHTCVVPASEQVVIIREYCQAQGISTSRLDFIIQPSELALPCLTDGVFDLVLVDGRHGFPAPMIDFYYTARRLRVGGYCIMDDTHLWPVEVVCEFLAGTPEWQQEAEIGRTIVFRKLRDGSEDQEWDNQPAVLKGNEQLRIQRQRQKALTLLRKGKILTLITKLAKRVLPRG